ncbi:MFS transporter [Paracoccus sediminilitoris]|uniref:MFS transporter n=1 Tax=Paracoccus sediminilitoris TaxID=2202419 RepID=UPI000DB8F9B5|nr:MFS transporter [Paracoccus sediminilitoris]
MIQFLRDNFRWPGAELLLTFTSAFGQTWFISLVAVFIKNEYGLTDGSWGSLYTVATLSASGLMFWRGAMADSVPLSRLAPAAAIGMAWAPLLWILGVALFLLRFCGQGGFSNIAMTPMGRWFEDRRGQAVSIAYLGHPGGEIIVPPLMVLLIGTIGWWGTWLVVVAMLCLTVAPLLSRQLLSEARTPVTHATQTAKPGLLGRQWQRSDAGRHWLLPAMLRVLLTPGFIATVISFHQAYVGQVKGGSLAYMAPRLYGFRHIDSDQGIRVGIGPRQVRRDPSAADAAASNERRRQPDRPGGKHRGLVCRAGGGRRDTGHGGIAAGRAVPGPLQDHAFGCDPVVGVDDHGDFDRERAGDHRHPHRNERQFSHPKPDLGAMVLYGGGVVLDHRRAGANRSCNGLIGGVPAPARDPASAGAGSGSGVCGKAGRGY